MQSQIETEEFVTIIAPSTREVLEQFREQRLAERGFYVAARMVPQRLSVVQGSGPRELFDGAKMIVATFARRIPA